MRASGKFLLRLPPDLHQQLKLGAQASEQSLNEFIKFRLMQPSTTVSDAYLELIKSTWGRDILGVVRFGSSVRGQQKKSSDIDLLIVLKKNIRIDRSLYRTWDEQVASQIGDKFSPQFSHLPDVLGDSSSLWLEIALEGEIEFEADNTMRDFIYNLKQKIAAGEFLRKISHGHPYWVRKNDAKS